MKKIFLFALMAVYASMAFAQVNPKPGFVIDLKNDTIWGDIDLRTDEYNMEKCTFRAEGRERWITFTPDQINGYRFLEDGKFYVSRFLPIKGERTLCFAEYMVKGEMNLYYIPVGERYYFENKEKKIAEYTYEFDDTFINGSDPTGLSESSRTENIRPLVALLKNSPSALEKISIYKMYREQLIDIAKAYHNDVCTSNEDCIEFVYDKRKDKTKLHYRIFAGGMYCPQYKLNDFKGNTTSYGTPAFGVGVDIELPKIAKGLSAQIQATYCMKAEMSGMLNASNDREFEYTANTTHLFIDAGAAYALMDTKAVCPVLRAGITANKVSEELMCITEKPTRDTMLFGCYAGAGVEVPAGKFAITFDVTGRLMLGCKSKGMIMATAGIRL